MQPGASYVSQFMNLFVRGFEEVPPPLPAKVDDSILLHGAINLVSAILMTLGAALRVCPIRWGRGIGCRWDGAGPWVTILHAWCETYAFFRLRCGHRAIGALNACRSLHVPSWFKQIDIGKGCL